GLVGRLIGYPDLLARVVESANALEKQADRRRILIPALANYGRDELEEVLLKVEHYDVLDPSMLRIVASTYPELVEKFARDWLRKLSKRSRGDLLHCIGSLSPILCEKETATRVVSAIRDVIHEWP